MRSYLVLAISAYITDVNFHYSSITENESFNPSLNKLLQEPCKLIL